MPGTELRFPNEGAIDRGGTAIQGFDELFARILGWAGEVLKRADLGFGPATYARAMGFPKRRPAQLLPDPTRKTREKMRR